MADLNDNSPHQTTTPHMRTPDPHLPALMPSNQHVMQVDTVSTRIAHPPSTRTPILDLPPELFQNIIHELVKDLGILRAWTFRSVCRTFAAEIEYDAFAKQDRRAIGKIYGDNRLPRPFWNQWIWKHISYKVQHLPADLDLLGTVFLHRIRDITGYLAKERNLNAEYKEWVLHSMCDLVSGRMHPTVLAQLLGLSPNSHFMYIRPKDVSQYVAPKVTLEMKLAVAAHLGDAEMVKFLLPHVDFSEYRSKNHVLFGDPLWNAATQGHDHIILLVVEYVRSGTPQFVQVRNQFRSSYMRYKIGSAKKRSSCNFNEVLADSMRFCDEATVEELLWLHRICTNKLHPDDYTDWLESSIRSENPRMLELVLEVNPDTAYQRPNIPWSLFELPRKVAFSLACQIHHPELVQTFMDLCHIGSNQVWERSNSDGTVIGWQSALDVAAKYGSPEVIAVLLDAGATIDGLGIPARVTQEESSSNGMRPTIREITPLEHAVIADNVAAVQYLIDRGANAQKVYWGNWEARRHGEDMFNIIRKARIERYGENVPTYDIHFGVGIARNVRSIGGYIIPAWKPGKFLALQSGHRYKQVKVYDSSLERFYESAQ
ncbi:hypothetical protein P171DRAFT_480899 [Karstenula rhodostoma CBS 690.94]|uniref:Ankyrin n=1 Tax=Karstenula rhodostoma CBS 690.94 TaxID=1392251 RepID=A0A9P4UH62_9PLEO|nr:hypothetical protein P171DRAFT_480899 [Karstenula rhodostoma CBS 690.94]